MPEQEVEMSPSGELSFKLPQQEWTGNDAIQSAHFAGQQMVISRSESNHDEYELHYLGLKVGGFSDIDEAKHNAPEFARSVLQILGDFIRDS
jgi:hypothetical protein